MSVKDKIAMWNSMASPSSNTATNTANKMANSEHLPKTKEQEPEKKHQIPHLSQEQKVAPKIEQTQEIKKTVVNEHPPNVKVEVQSKPLHQSLKPKEVSKKQEVPKPQPTHEVEGGSVPSFKEAKKMMENQTAGKGLMGFAPPAPVVHIKRVESETVEDNGARAECEIEKDVPVVSVKERAAQLALFYEKKRKQSEGQPNPVVEQKKERQEQLKQPKGVDLAKVEETKPQQNSCLNISAQHNEGSNKIIEPSPTQNIASPPSSTNEPGLALRFQNRSKKTKQQFESDED